MPICCALGECVENFVVEVAQADRVPVVFFVTEPALIGLRRAGLVLPERMPPASCS